MCFTRTKNESGFTLVELAIALMIIGLLIGGVLKGIELVENARVTQVMRNVKGYETAVTAFQSMYVAMPGDINNPSARLPSCDAVNHAVCANAGNGNGMVGTSNTTGATAPDPVAIDEENRNFWLHLAVTGLISGVEPQGTSDPVTDGIIWGEAYPASPVIGAGYMIQHMRMNGAASYQANARFSGHFIELRGVTIGTPGVLTGNQAVQIDNKFDDGSPISGDIFADLTSVGDANCVDTNAYVVDNDERACAVYFKMTR